MRREGDRAQEGAEAVRAAVTIAARSRRALALGALAGLLTACAKDAATTAADATPPMDLGVVNDLATDTTDAWDASDAGADDGAAEEAVDAGVDVPVDHRDAPNPWGDATLVDLGTIVVPVDPHGVPAPGSECTSDASVREGDPSIAPPRPIRPLSVSRVSSQRPTFQWVLPEGTTGARIEVCADRCCTRVIQSFDAEGTSARPMTALPPGVVFWRMFGRRAGFVGSRASYTWEFGVRHRDAPNDTSWGTLHDFNGDGFDDVIIVRWPESGGRVASVRVAHGSAMGLLASVDTGLTTNGYALQPSSGDINGDGLADIAWLEAENGGHYTYSLYVLVGTRGGIRQVLHMSGEVFGPCSQIRGATVVDWNGDGYSDVVASIQSICSPSLSARDSSLLVYRGSPDGIGPLPQRAERLDEDISFPLVRPACNLSDYDLDGYGDVVVTSEFNGAGTPRMDPRVRIAHGSNHGAARFDVISDPALRGTPPCVPAGDVDGDHHTDFVLSQAFPISIRFYRYGSGLEGPWALLHDPLGAGTFGQVITQGERMRSHAFSPSSKWAR